MGAAVVVVTNDRAREGDRIAASLAQKLWDTRREFEVKLTPVKEAIRLATATKGSPVVLSESADSTGSGSPGDSTGVLKHLLNSRLSGPAAIFLVDPEAVAKLKEAGVGSHRYSGDRRETRPAAFAAGNGYGPGAPHLGWPMDFARTRLQYRH